MNVGDDDGKDEDETTDASAERKQIRERVVSEIEATKRKEDESDQGCGVITVFRDGQQWCVAGWLLDESIKHNTPPRSASNSSSSFWNGGSALRSTTRRRDCWLLPQPANQH